jgi:hypothetical protein
VSARIAIGAVAALAALGALQARGGARPRAGAGSRQKFGASLSKTPHFDEMARRFRQMIQDSMSWGHPSDSLVDLFIEREQDRGIEIRLLGQGRDRTVFQVDDGALKIEHHEGPGTFNLNEAKAWRSAPPDLRPYLVPVLGVADDGAWLLMELVEPRDVSEYRPLPFGVEEAFRRCGIVDLTKGENISTDGRVIDYSFIKYPEQWEDCASGVVDIRRVLGSAPKPPPRFEIRYAGGDSTTRTPPGR